jgi:hypothetical protein
VSFLSVIAAGRGFDLPAGVREPAVDGSFYPADPVALSVEMERLCREAPATAKLPGPIRAMICPHAGYSFSGRGAAANYRLLQPGQFERVILLGPTHQVAMLGASVPAFTAFRTPLGDVPVDMDALAELRRCSAVTNAPEAHRREHCLEVQLPFLQKQLGAFSIVPVVLGNLTVADYQALASALLPLWDPKTLVVVSSDFCHYGRAYEYEPFGKATREMIAELDRAALDQIMAVSPRGFDEYLAVSNNTICGRVPITLLLLMAQQRSIPPEPVLTSYYLSGDATGHYDLSVSYASIVFCEVTEPWHFDPPPAKPVNEQEKRALLRLARHSIEQAVKGSSEVAIALDGLTPNLARPGAAFVTLTQAGQLRGCIGSLVAVEPLALSVARNAVNAATKDPRFPAVRAEDVPQLHIKISVLTPPEPLEDIKAFVPGKHGLILQKDGRRGLFLPEVMVEEKWDREQTLANLCRKAGLPPDAWRAGYALFGFETQVFGEDP